MPVLDLLPPIPGLRFEEARHRYLFADRNAGELHVPSTTQIMGSVGAKATNFSRWRVRLMTKGLTAEESAACGSPQGIALDERGADQFMEWWRSTRAQVGTDFHLLAQHHLLNQQPLPKQPPEPTRMFELWLEQWAHRVRIVQLSEQPLIHKAAFYCGTPDLLAVIEGVPHVKGAVAVVVDWKTCLPDKARVRSEWLLQQGAYWELIRRCYGVTVKHGLNLIIWDGGIQEKWWNLADLRQGWQLFAGFLMEYHAREAAAGGKANRIALTALEAMI